ncbi:PEP-CTERM sorting domain-containing protein [Iodobacter sp. CM08]|uniref:PEP-CTERM sorting domain-containing protein n=1 Tax=Iodobacter sp. CM08 TaxID=3085902 RepID=UPI0029819CA3|nr:PEP-CTERM sorting domain-containing protein [Iodobacter sp. CM08]MDW5416077.1 PEP-CTERM sorting domain-containing protein [Iodobacter sp. CM08]
MKLFQQSITFFLLALSLAISSTVFAKVINFDDLPSTGDPITGLYNGFTWNNVFTDGNYTAATISGHNVAFNGYGDPASFSSTNPFQLNDLYVSMATLSGITHFEGYVGNTLTFHSDIAAQTTSATHAIFNWSGLNKVVFYSTGPFANSSLLDNINVTTPVPEPETYALLGLGLIALFSTRKRRSN